MFVRISTLIAALAFAALASTADATTAKPQDCFLSTTWKGWSPINNGNSILIRAGLNEIYQVDLTPGAYVRRDPNYWLVNDVRGSAWICSPVDLQLKLANSTGTYEPLIARSMRRLTPEEVAAIPKRDFPY